MTDKHGLESEAVAFDQRIEERKKAGFVPDIRRAVKCEYFYKSFWRDPYFINLYIGEMVKNYLRMLQESGGNNLRILDAGCGAGYISLELARAGYHVVGIDISESCIETAKETLKSNPFKDGFGSLEYHVMPFSEAEGIYDAILFSGALHHFDNLEQSICKAIELLSSDGLILCHEPCHEEWRKEDAAQVALIRGLLSLTGFWYEPELGNALYLKDNLESYIDDIHVEYVTESDKHEQGQSPNDNAATGQEIVKYLRMYLDEIEHKKSFSFIYRLLGGIRGRDETVYKIADILTSYDKFSVNKGFLRPNYFYFIGRKKTDCKQ